MITIIDYGVGNIAAFQNVYNRLNIPVNVAKNLTDLDGSDKLILPGVGSFDYAMSQLNNSGMREKLDHLVLKERIPRITRIKTPAAASSSSVDKHKTPGGHCLGIIPTRKVFINIYVYIK